MEKAKIEAKMTEMATYINKEPKGEDPLVPRGFDCKEEKEASAMVVEWGDRGRTIVSYYAMGKRMKQKGETKDGNEEEEEEALLDMSNRLVVMDEAVAKVIAEANEQHHTKKELL